jgi:signal transduction histidine kinase
VKFLFHSLHLKIALGVIGTVVVLSTLHFFWDYRFYRSQLLFEAQESVSGIAEVTLDSILQLAMLGEHPELLQDAVESLARDSKAQEVMIIDSESRVRFASDRRSVGTEFSLEDDPGCNGCHLNRSDPPKTRFIELQGKQIIRHAEPIPNRVECQSCHSSNASLLGILLVDFPTVGVQEKLRDNLSELILKAGTTVFFILIVLGFLMNRVVISRIKRLKELVSDIGPDRDLPELDYLAGPDEIGQLAGTFRQMALSLKDHCRQLEEKEIIRVSLLERLVHSQEEERRTISRELHDQLGQSLSALLLTFQTGFAGQEDENPELRAGYEDIQARIQGLIDDVHQLAWQMRPSILDDYGLDRALQRLIAETAKHATLQFDYEQIPTGGFERLPIWLELTLYRIAQEAINNAIKHSEATRVTVMLIKRDNTITLLIEDNGKGFETSETVPSGDHGLGLLGMKERTAQCGGTLHIESAPNKGTTIWVRIPI